MTEHDSLQKIVADTKNLFAFHDACNLNYPITEELQSFLRPKILKQKKKKTLDSSPGNNRISSLTLSEIQDEIKTCQCCALQQQKDTALLNEGMGIKRPELLIISDWDYSEKKNSSGLMSNEARELLTKMLAAIQLTWEDVCICPIVKCPPASDKAPTKDEIQSCLAYLLRQIEILKPKVICTMGKASSQYLLKSDKQLFALRGKFYSLLNIPLMPTFHPALLLKHPELKKASWQDLQLIRQKIDSADIQT